MEKKIVFYGDPMISRSTIITSIRVTQKPDKVQQWKQVKIVLCIYLFLSQFYGNDICMAKKLYLMEI